MLNDPRSVSILVPGIRTYNWEDMYKSIEKSTSSSFELIFVGPVGLPEPLRDKSNVKFIQDFGCPSRCQQIALLNSRGNFVLCCADDALFVENSLDKCFELVTDRKKEIIVIKYTESDNPAQWMFGSSYWYIGNHYICPQCIPRDWFLVMGGLVKREYAIEMGGWDCQFRTTALGHVDFGLRTQRDGCECKLFGEIVYKCSHMPGETGDHGPVHRSQTRHDEPLFVSMYNNSDVVNRIKIPIDNWKKQDSIWKERFGNAA